MITHFKVAGVSSLINVTSPVTVFTSTSTNGDAITTIALCNTGAPTLTDETVNSLTVNVYVVSTGVSRTEGDCIVKNLIIPAGETVFLSEERLILENGAKVEVSASVADLLAVTISTLPV